MPRLGVSDSELSHERSQLIVPDIFLFLNLVQNLITHAPRINRERRTRDAYNLILIAGQTPLKYAALLRYRVVRKPVPPAGPELVCRLASNPKIPSDLVKNRMPLRKLFVVSNLPRLLQILLVKRQTTTQAEERLVPFHLA